MHARRLCVQRCSSVVSRWWLDWPDAMASNEPLIIIDLQRAFPVPKKVVAAIARYARGFDLRVFTRFVNPEGSLFRKLMGMEECAPGSEDLELLIPPAKGDLVFNKQGYGLTRQHITKLKARGVKRAVVCGIETDACVLGVMFSLFDAGIACHVKPDLCWSSTGLHQQGLKIIGKQFPAPRRGAEVTRNK